MENQQFLKAGDFIKLKNGMKVYTEAPQKFFMSNRKFSDKVDTHWLEIGTTYYNDIHIQPDIDAIVKDIMKAFQYKGVNINETKVVDFVWNNIQGPSQDSFCVPEGIFKVFLTTYEGGGSMGRNDVYADGYKVWAQDVNSDRIVSFYQSGDFDAMITDIKPL